MESSTNPKGWLCVNTASEKGKVLHGNVVPVNNYLQIHVLSEDSQSPLLSFSMSLADFQTLLLGKVPITLDEINGKATEKLHPSSIQSQMEDALNLPIQRMSEALEIILKDSEDMLMVQQSARKTDRMNLYAQLKNVILQAKTQATAISTEYRAVVNKTLKMLESDEENLC